MKNDKPPVSDTLSASRESRNESRRRLVKAVAAGGGAAVVGSGAAGSWVTPSVQSAILPAHAQATGFERARVAIELVNRFSPMDLFLNEAHAVPSALECPFPTDLCFQTLEGSGVMQVFAGGTFNGGGTYSASTTVAANATSFVLDIDGCLELEFFDVSIDASASPRTISGMIRCENGGNGSCDKYETNAQGFEGPFVPGTC